MNVNEVDFTSPFKFHAQNDDTEYTCTPYGEVCTVSWEPLKHEQGYTQYATLHVKDLIERCCWTVTYQKKSLPEKFKFQCHGNDIIYTATWRPELDNYRIEWRGFNGDTVGMTFWKRSVENNVENGTWVIVQEPEDAIPQEFSYCYKGVDTVYNACLSNLTGRYDIRRDYAAAISFDCSKETVAYNIKSGFWTILKLSEELPKQFNFISIPIEHIGTAILNDVGEYYVTWGAYSCIYIKAVVERYIKNGTWVVDSCQQSTPTMTIGEINRASESNFKTVKEGVVVHHAISRMNELRKIVSEQIEMLQQYSPSGAAHSVVTLESIIAQYAKASAHKHEQQCPNAYANEALKAFTEATGASVSVVKGTYTILYNEACYEAEDDEKLNDIIKCITFLESV